MSLGPIDVVALAFEGNQFSGQILPALDEAVKSGAIRIVDLTFIRKGADGDVQALELHEMSDEAAQALGQLAQQIGELLSADDLRQIGDELVPNSSAAVLVFEHAWAARLKQAIVDANGRLVTQLRIPHEVVEYALQASAAGA